MAKKPVVKSGSVQENKSRETKIGNLTGGVVVGGNVKAGRDVIAGDQITTTAQQRISAVSTQEFLEELKKLQTQIAILKQSQKLSSTQLRRIEVVESDTQDVIDEIQKPSPSGARMNDILSAAKLTLDNLAENLSTASSLSTIFATLGQIALKLFSR
jgi:hypothetical protein